MKKIFTSLTCCLLLSAFSFQAKATVDNDAFKTPMGDVVPGKPFTLSSTGEYYIYTPTENGVIEVQTNNKSSENYAGTEVSSSAMWGQQVFFAFQYVQDYEAWAELIYNTATLESQGWLFSLNVTANTEYRFAYAGNLESSVTLTVLAGEIKDPDPQGISSVEPAAGGVFDFNLYQDIVINATASIESFGEATCQYGNTTITLNEDGDYANFVKLNGPPTSQFLQIGGSNAMFPKLFDTAAESGATSITFTVKNVVAGGVNLTLNNNFAGVSVEDGTVSVTYNIQPIPKYLSDESTWPNPFYNYWNPDNAEAKAAATAEVKFSQDIATVGSVFVTMGTITPGSSSGENNYPVYNIPSNKLTVSGNTLTIDFSGQTFTGTQSQVTISVQDVKTADGLTANLGEFGVISQYVSYKNEPYPVVNAPAEPTYYEPLVSPESGQDYEEGDDIIIYISFEDIESISENETIEYPVNVTDGLEDGFSMNYAWEPGSVYVDQQELEVVINLGDGLEPGKYTLTFARGAVNINEIDFNEGVENYTFTVVAKDNGDDSGNKPDDDPEDKPGEDKPGEDKPGEEPGQTPDDTPSGVSGIQADANGLYNVYNFQGVKVLSSDASALKTLQPGIYIINGKKLMVK